MLWHVSHFLLAALLPTLRSLRNYEERIMLIFKPIIALVSFASSASVVAAKRHHLGVERIDWTTRETHLFYCI
jgi:hypothetical protein